MCRPGRRSEISENDAPSRLHWTKTVPRETVPSFRCRPSDSTVRGGPRPMEIMSRNTFSVSKSFFSYSETRKGLSQKELLGIKEIRRRDFHSLSKFRSFPERSAGTALGLRCWNFGTSLNGDDATARRNPSVPNYWSHRPSCMYEFQPKRTRTSCVVSL